MSWRTLCVKDSERIRLKLDNVEIIKNGRKIDVPLSDIESIILEGQDTTISTRLLAKLGHNHIMLIVCDQKYLPAGIFIEYGQYHRSAKRVREQILWSEQLIAEAWQRIVYQKMKNQITLAQYLKVPTDRLELMTSLAQAVEPGDPTNREGHVAKVYFNSLYGNDFSRDLDCIENMIMNFGYTIIRSYIARVTVAEGLITARGLFHSNEYNQFNLVDDLMEPFRPIVDYWMHKAILDNDMDHLTYEKRLKIIDIVNQPMFTNDGKLTTLDMIMNTYINNFIYAMNNNDLDSLYIIDLNDFINANEEDVKG